MIDILQKRLEEKYPNAKIYIRKADDPLGFQFLNFYLDKVEAAVEWKHDRGFGMDVWHENDNKVFVAFSKSDFYCDFVFEAFEHIVSLIERK